MSERNILFLLLEIVAVSGISPSSGKQARQARQASVHIPGRRRVHSRFG
jgi:hypothetical protein